MGIFDRFKHNKGNAGGTGVTVKNRLTEMAASHSSQVDQGLDKAARMVDDKTGNKYSNQINTSVGKAKEMFHKQTGQDGDATIPGNLPHPDTDAQGADPTQPPQS